MIQLKDHEKVVRVRVRIRVRVRARKDWNELEVEGIDQWMKLVENKGWLSSMLRSSGGAGSEGGDEADERTTTTMNSECK